MASINKYVKRAVLDIEYFINSTVIKGSDSRIADKQ